MLALSKLWAVLLINIAGCACAQDFPLPNKPLRIVTTGVGGASDFSARIVAQGLTAALGRSFIVDNRVAGVVPGQVVAQVPRDGHTLLVNSAVLWLRPLLRTDVPYDPVKQFAAISTINRSFNVLVVTPSLPVESVKELIAHARARPGALNYSTGSTGSAGHLAQELFKSITSVELTRIPYKSGASEMADLISGQVQVAFGIASLVMPHVKSGKLRALGVSSLKPTPLAPGVPTISDSGVPGYQMETMTGLWAPAATPAAIIQRLNQELAAYLGRQEVKDRFFAAGSESVASSPKEFSDYIAFDMAKWGKVIKAHNIRDED